ncbi:uncharacterized protein ACBT44_013428 [Syngnathus typhle]
MCVSGGRVFERMSRQESCFQCGNMRGLLSCLFLASHCALSSRSGASTLHVSQSANVTVLEGQLVNISCCWTGNFSRGRVELVKNKIGYKKLQICQKTPNQSCHAAVQKDGMTCVWLELLNVTTEHSGIYICNVSADIPTLISGNGNGTVVRVTRQSSNGTAEGDVADESTSPSWPLLGGSLASVGFLLLVALACYCKLKQRAVTRVIYESPNFDSDMDKRSSGSSSTGSSEWNNLKCRLTHPCPSKLLSHQGPSPRKPLLHQGPSPRKPLLHQGPRPRKPLLHQVFDEYASAEGRKDTLNKTEVGTLVKKELPQLFEAAEGIPEGQTLLLDFDGDGEMDFKEFMVAMSCLACIFKTACAE